MSQAKFEMEYLGAFLHDIGKFAYRAGIWKGDHEARGKKFIDTIFNTLRISHYSNEFNISLLKTYVERGSTNIQIADAIAAKERVSEKGSSLKTLRPLVSILSRVQLYDDKRLPKIHYYNPSPINFTIDMPRATNLNSTKDWKIDEFFLKSYESTYAQTFVKFVDEISILYNILSFRPFFTTLYKLFEKYTSLISSASYVSSPDISLFDHSRVVAALTSCISSSQAEKQCLLVKGDISGIQKFIFYDIEEATRAAKQLRGRSFYVRLLADTVANYIIRQLGLYDANILFCSGGHFLLLLPNNETNISKLKEIEKRINLSLLEKFGGILQVVLAYDSYTKDWLGQNFDLMSIFLDYELNTAKTRKSFSVLSEVMNFEMVRAEGLEKFEKLFQDIGTNIVKSEYLLEIVHPGGDPRNFDGEGTIRFDELGTIYCFVSKDLLLEKLKKLETFDFEYCIIHNLRNTDLNEIYQIAQKSQISFKVAFSFKYVGSYVPTDKKLNDKPLTFEELANLDDEIDEENKSDENSDGSYPLLGVAKMDVDNLGRILSGGLKKPTLDGSKETFYSVSRFAMLSRELDRFFCGHINSIAEKHRVYLVYAGGDDLFAVGNWAKIIDFVQSVQKEFQKFCCGNENITISCGTVFVKPNYPVARFAKEANEQLEKAKRTSQFKNQISIFYREVSWSNFNFLLNIGKLLYQTVSDKNLKDKLPRSFIHQLLTLTQQCLDENGNIVVDKVHQVTSKLHYAFARRELDNTILSQKALNDKLNIQIVLNQLDEQKELNNEIEESFLRIFTRNFNRQKEINNEIKESFIRIFARYFIMSEPEIRKFWYKNFQIPASYVILKTRKVNK